MQACCSRVMGFFNMCQTFHAGKTIATCPTVATARPGVERPACLLLSLKWGFRERGNSRSDTRSSFNWRRRGMAVKMYEQKSLGSLAASWRVGLAGLMLAPLFGWRRQQQSKICAHVLPARFARKPCKTQTGDRFVRPFAPFRWFCDLAWANRSIR